MKRHTLAEILSACKDSPFASIAHAQVTAIEERTTKTGKPFLDLELADGEASLKLKIWEDYPRFSELKALAKGCFIQVSAKWSASSFGPQAERLEFEELGEEQKINLLQGSDERAKVMDRCWSEINRLIASIVDPRLNKVCATFVDKFGGHLERTAAARQFHHARRGGLLEHVAQMMMTGDKVCAAYPQLNRDLLLAGILFHDSGKLWENSYQKEGFEMPYQQGGELLGHIPLGIELVNHLFQSLDTDKTFTSSALEPPLAEVKLHLQHLVASHHGTHEFGSPTLPKTPEAIALHHIDNLDAKLEMFTEAYQQAPKLSEKVHERHRPLPTRTVVPLKKFRPQEE